MRHCNMCGSVVSSHRDLCNECERHYNEPEVEREPEPEQPYPPCELCGQDGNGADNGHVFCSAECARCFERERIPVGADLLSMALKAMDGCSSTKEQKGE